MLVVILAWKVLEIVHGCIYGIPDRHVVDICAPRLGRKRVLGYRVHWGIGQPGTDRRATNTSIGNHDINSV
jgi:hypothetical protein